MLEVDVATSPASCCFDRLRQPGVSQRKPRQRLFPAVARIDIEDNDAGDRSRHDGYVGRLPRSTTGTTDQPRAR